MPFRPKQPGNVDTGGWRMALVAFALALLLALAVACTGIVIVRLYHLAT